MLAPAACARCRPPGRDAGRGPQRDPGLLGRSSCPGPRPTIEPSLHRPRLHPPLRGPRDDRPRHLQRGPAADRDGRPDRRLDQPGALPDGPGRAQGRAPSRWGRRAGRRSAASSSRRRPRARRRRVPRARPGARRGDRRDPGDRRGQPDPRALFDTGDTLASRIASQFQGATKPLRRVALLPRAGALAIGLVATCGPVDLPPLRPARGADQDDGRSTRPPLDASGNLRRRLRINRMAETPPPAPRARRRRARHPRPRVVRAGPARSAHFLTEDIPASAPPAGASARRSSGTACSCSARPSSRCRSAILVALFRTEFAAPRRPGDPPRARPAQRPAVDRDRAVRLRPARVRPPPERLRGIGRAVDHHAAADRPADPGGAARPPEPRDAAHALGISRWRTRSASSCRPPSAGS